MTASNRFLNRLLLAVIGLIACGTAVAIGWEALVGEPLAVALPARDDVVALGAIVAVAVIVVAFSVLWIATRGRGQVRLALDTPGVRLDASAVEAIVRARLAGSPDLAGVRVRCYRVRGERMLLLAVQTRRHPDLVSLKGELDRAVRAADDVLGVALPAVVHVTTGVRTALSGTRTTH